MAYTLLLFKTIFFFNELHFFFAWIISFIILHCSVYIHIWWILVRSLVTLFESNLIYKWIKIVPSNLHWVAIGSFRYKTWLTKKRNFFGSMSSFLFSAYFLNQSCILISFWREEGIPSIRNRSFKYILNFPTSSQINPLSCFFHKIHILWTN